MIEREPKENDFEMLRAAVGHLEDLMKEHPEIEGIIWWAAIHGKGVNMFLATGYSYEDYSKNIEDLKNQYKKLWDDKEKA